MKFKKNILIQFNGDYEMSNITGSYLREVLKQAKAVEKKCKVDLAVEIKDDDILVFQELNGNRIPLWQGNMRNDVERLRGMEIACGALIEKAIHEQIKKAELESM